MLLKTFGIKDPGDSKRIEKKNFVKQQKHVDAATSIAQTEGSEGNYHRVMGEIVFLPSSSNQRKMVVTKSDQKKYENKLLYVKR